MLSSDADPNEVTLIKDHLRATTQRRNALEPAMEVLSAALEGLATEHASLSREIELVSASIAPIRKLPLETLSRIFEFCALSDNESPILLYTVCRKWKDAAMCPRLWARIIVDVEDEWAEQKTSFYLKRSRNSMLHVHLRRPGYFKTGDEPGWCAWFQVLLHASRWRTLEISASTFGEINEVLEDLPTLAPDLVETIINVSGVFLSHPSDQIQYSRLTLVPQFISYPKFCNLHLHTWALPHLKANHPSTTIVHHLTTLTLSDTFASTFPDVHHPRLHPICGKAISALLRQCAALETFIFDARDSVRRHSGRVCKDPSGSANSIFTLPALQHLVLMAHHLDLFTIIDRLSLPALRTAHIEPLSLYSTCLIEKFCHSWREFFLRSKEPQLEEFHVSGMNPANIVWTLERTPQLRSLQIGCCSSPAAVFRALVARRGDPQHDIRWLCPSLRCLSFTECFPMKWKTVAWFIRERHRAYREGQKVRSMVNLVINGHDVFEDRDLDTLIQLKLRHITTLIEP